MSATLYVLSTLGGYVLTSALLLKCPGLLHRPKRQRFRCRHISHRGGAGENLENTMAAFHQYFRAKCTHVLLHKQGCVSARLNFGRCWAVSAALRGLVAFSSLLCTQGSRIRLPRGL